MYQLKDTKIKFSDIILTKDEANITSIQYTF